MVSALIFAGGIGQRMKTNDIPKQFLKVEGKPIIIRTLEHFSSHSQIDNIVISCIESWIEVLKKELERYEIKKVISIVPGGETGHQSIHMGLVRIAEIAKAEDIVLICDGVRPMLNQSLITTCINDAIEYGSAVPVTASINSVLYSDDGKYCRKSYKRNSMFITQAPQGFHFGKIMWAHDEAEKRKIEPLSSGELLIELGENIHIFEGIRENIKVTTPEDLHMLRASQYYEHFKEFAKELSEYEI